MQIATSTASKPTGPGAAAALAAGLGVFVIGLITSLAEASASLKNSLAWYTPVGPLSGKMGVGVLAWLVAWIVLHNAWKTKPVNFGQTFRWTLTPDCLGVLADVSAGV
jgi:hypothetical protein